MAPGRAASIQSALDALDEIGKEIQREATREATNEHRKELKGNLAHAVFLNGRTLEYANTNVCELSHTHDTNVSWGESNPCYKRLDERFSDEGRSQCTSNRIRDSNDKCGSCAPYRKLKLCDYNLEKITDTNITNTHNLLVDVLLAAKYEGNSLSKYMNENQGTVPKSNVCTVLARSFADIGDIIRGKDLYLGNKKHNEAEREKEKLQRNLKYIFKKIYDNLSDPKARDHYNDAGENYYKLREDWWNANRQQVWKAITCAADDNDTYSKYLGDVRTTHSYVKCGHHVDQDVPTNLDYVPQFLRWFEEWAEDFCRKKKKYVDIVKTYCRGQFYNQPRYCSRNGFDCEQTIYKKGYFVIDKGCINCLYACNRYVEWMDNKKKEFLKQKEKCENEIYKNSNQSKSISSSVNDIYYENFYKELKGKYSSIDKFLKSLNAETKCKNLENEDNESKIDFNNSTTTFSGSEYCQPCPPCGVDCNNEACTHRPINHPKCQKANKYTPTKGAKETDIKVLSSGEKREDITKKLKDFCDTPSNNNNSSLYELWKCYYQSDQNEACILEKVIEGNEKGKIEKSFYDFFTYWVAHMLKDSEDWKTKLSKCLKNDKKACINNCNRNCKCYEKWIEKKVEEWGKIKQHYEKQKLPKDGHYVILERFLELQFIKGITNAYGDPSETERIKKMLEKKNTEEKDDDTTHRSTIIDELLKHELEDAKKCINKNPNETCTEDTSHDIDDHFEDDEDDELPSAPNPCSGDPSGSSTTHRSMVKTVAREMHRKAHQEAKGRELSKLRADATKGKYTKKNGKASKFNDICDITLQHSNRNTGHSSEPCQGKDKKGEMFQLQNGWKTGRKIDMTDEYAYMPPRRQHMCTSNLENLQTKCGPLKGEDGANVNDSFLGHILLSANKEAEWLKNKYKKQPGYGDDATICRAMKYSFADLGDIIRGRDLWDKENGMKHLQDHLIDVFKNIKEKLPGIKVNDKYPQDENKTPPYKKLREDWWEANRKEVWRAMTCATTSGKIPCSIVTPLDDYIPQRLRWMTEWAESFCKMQSQEYEKLEEKCSQCRTDGIKKCTNKTSECDKCTPACKAYREKIKEWEKQWNKMYMKYTLLYLPAQRNFAGYVFRDDSPDYKQMLDFLQQLLPPKSGTNNPKTPYSSAAGYIHQEVPHMQCKGQTRFCEETHPEYAFKDPPKEYATACTCKDRDEPPPPPPPPPTVVDVCTTVATALAEDNLNEACRQKYEYGREKFPNWKCIPTSDGSSNPTSDKGAICVPPRRRKLYVGELTKWAKTSGNTQGG
ncbi:hypothetical protein PFTANZ_05927, partial [Plasmodium falciparum Tanzania (2000708)]